MFGRYFRFGCSVDCWFGCIWGRGGVQTSKHVACCVVVSALALAIGFTLVLISTFDLDTFGRACSTIECFSLRSGVWSFIFDRSGCSEFLAQLMLACVFGCSGFFAVAGCRHCQRRSHQIENRSCLDRGCSFPCLLMCCWIDAPFQVLGCAWLMRLTYWPFLVRVLGIVPELPHVFQLSLRHRFLRSLLHHALDPPQSHQKPPPHTPSPTWKDAATAAAACAKCVPGHGPAVRRNGLRYGALWQSWKRRTWRPAWRPRLLRHMQHQLQ